MPPVKKRKPTSVRPKRAENKYKFTPKGIFAAALLSTGLIEDLEDERLSRAWAQFEDAMRTAGYIVEG